MITRSHVRLAVFSMVAMLTVSALGSAQGEVVSGTAEAAPCAPSTGPTDSTESTESTGFTDSTDSVDPTGSAGDSSAAAIHG
ncbi:MULTISPECIES: hypothetical protein [Streptosporangium]|uniref:Uncharacterized protein n=1 Tax=Streptosporangium brasiliense TaxID=47480 RepID=A0ABT9R462_9ACTN|nr:hypothetical protein [Streptosporangium brasiliense]MDP9863963.1 hypothetical protein [Streptosporangium brasiliense]